MSLTLLLNDQIEKLFSENPELSLVPKNQFEVAVAAFANLKHLNGLDFDDLIDGIIGEGGDEGIDHCYIFNNGDLVSDELTKINKDSNIKVKFFQTKKENGFSTDGFRKLKEGIENIFNFDLDEKALAKIGANRDIIEVALNLRRVFQTARKEKAKFSCEVFYVTVSPEKQISEKIYHFEKEIKDNSLKIPFEFNYFNAQDLLDLTDDVTESVEIKFVSQPLEIKEKGISTSGFSGFVNGNALIKALRDESNVLRSHLTEGNVRFFLGEDKGINKSIIDSARDKIKSENFWAMNNGLTIIGDDIESLGNNQYQISNPQIVNGCQTLHCLDHAYKEMSGSLHESLKVFVKLVNTENIEVQTDIISATNSQNPVKSASLKANDDIQRNVEKTLAKSGIFYERRENYYKRKGYKGNKVIGLLKMGQIINTVVNKESVISLNDPTTLFNTQAKYDSIFNNSADFDVYGFATLLYQKIWTLKNSDLRLNDYKDIERELISKGGLILLNCMSSFIFSDSKIGTGKELTDAVQMFGKITIYPHKKNEFSKRKLSANQLLNDDVYMKNIYDKSKETLKEAEALHRLTKAGSIFKNRNFDKDFLLPLLDRKTCKV